MTTHELIRLHARIAARAADPAVQDWHAQHANDPHAPCARCGATHALTLTTCPRCTFALCPTCYLLHVVLRNEPGSESLCLAVQHWAEMHAAFHEDDAEPSAEDFAAAREALKGYLRC